MIGNDIIWVHLIQYFFYLSSTNFPIFALVALCTNLDDESRSRTIYLSLLIAPRRVLISPRLASSRSEAPIG
jgi:hypothetical protein